MDPGFLVAFSILPFFVVDNYNYFNNYNSNILGYL